MTEGKKLTSSINAAFEWLNVSDSHGALFGPFLNRNGVNNVAISGGTLTHLYNYTVNQSFFKESMSALILLAGGNDLAMESKAPMAIATQLGDIIKAIHAKRPGCVIITGSVIARTNKWDFSWGDYFIRRTELLDSCIQQQGEMHHHYLTDVFVGESVGFYGPVNPKLDLFAGDMIHLNSKGREVLEQIYSFIFDSLVSGDFTGTCPLPSPATSPRRIFWKF